MILLPLFAAATAPIAAPRATHACKNCPASGRIWYVDVSQNSNSPDGQGWDTAFRSLQDAIHAASDNDCIWVAAGRYEPTEGTDRNASFLIDKSLQIYGGFSGTEACWDERGTNYSGTRLSGDIGIVGDESDNSLRIVTISVFTPFGSPSGKVLIDGFMIRDAYNDQIGGNGGGVTMTTYTHLDLRNCIIRDNRTAGHGAGLYVSSGSFDVALTKFVSNAAGIAGQTTANGGGLFATNITKDCLLHNVEFKHNSATGNGGAFLARQFGTPPGKNHWLRFANGLFHGNTAVQGGAGYAADRTDGQFPQHRAQVELWNCTLSQNSASAGGTALFAEESHVSGQPQLESPKNARLFLFDSIVWGNDLSGEVIDATASSLSTFGSSEIYSSIVEPPGSYWDCSQGACFTQPQCYVFACNPLFAATFHLGPGSPAIDEVNSALSGVLPADALDLDDDRDTIEALPTDLDGRPRVSPNGFIDMGCYEL
jgi:predicted outer membrane repeat protein